MGVLRFSEAVKKKTAQGVRDQTFTREPYLANLQKEEY